MKLKWIFLAAAVFASTSVLADDAASQFKDRKEQESYAIGAQTVRNLKKDGIDLDVDALVQGLKDGYAGDKLRMSEKELRTVMSGVQSKVHNAMVTNRRALGMKNKEDSAAWLADNGRKPGVVTTESGLQYKVIKAGSGGMKPKLSDDVLVKYRGTLLDGTEFDASPEDHPSEMTVVQTVPGFKEALQLMEPGARLQIAVPWNLAYGERGIGTQIGPYQSLLFEVELVSIKPSSDPRVPPGTQKPDAKK